VYDYEGDEKQRGFLRVQDGRMHVVVSFKTERAGVKDFTLIIPRQNGARSLERKPIGDEPRPQEVSGKEHVRAQMEFDVEAKEIEAVETELGGVILHRVYLGFSESTQWSTTNFAIPFRVLRQPETDPNRQRQ